MSHRLTRTALMAILIPIIGACAGGSANLVPGTQSYQQEMRRVVDQTITPAAVLTNISVIADDSMGGRNTPSTGLEKTAAYFAGKYQEWGLQPMGENGTFFQRYPLVKKGVDQEAAFLEVSMEGVVTRFPMGKWGFVQRGSSNNLLSANLMVLAGALTPEAISAADLQGSIVLALYDSKKAADWNRWLRVIRQGNPAAMVIVRNDTEDMFERFRPDPSRMRYSVDQGTAAAPEMLVHDSLFASNPATASWPNFNDMRNAPTATVMQAPASISMSLYAPEKVFERTSAPNVVAMIPGSDPVLKNEYVIYSGHMDHVGTAGDGVGGCRATGADSICNGADDDASGSTGILMVAKAYSKLKIAPKRSIIILHVSGEEKGLLGSAWFAEHPTIPEAQVVADINYDMIGRNNPDSIVVIGKEHSDMGTTLARVNANHPELNLVTADDIWPDERFYFRSDHYNFARKGIPILFFFNGVHEDYHRATDHVDKINTDKLSRVAKIGFYLGAEIANTVQRPKWVPESYKEIVGSSR